MSDVIFPTQTLAKFGDDRGSLVVAEASGSCPFPIRRVFWVVGTSPGVSRGFHAHVESRQLAVCVAGACSMLMDDGKSRETVRLDSPDKALLIEPMVWHEMHDFTTDCVLLVMSDATYDESDYIRDKARFDELVGKD
jgi:dTDP-4-dehydrorhamnose 3,5-epimerase-like enzyme